MLHKQIFMVVLLAGSFLASACTTNPRYELVSADLGRSHETTKFSQTVNPDAFVTGLPIETIDGPIADIINKKLLDDFKKEVKATPVIELDSGRK